MFFLGRPAGRERQAEWLATLDRHFIYSLKWNFRNSSNCLFILSLHGSLQLHLTTAWFHSSGAGIFITIIFIISIHEKYLSISFRVGSYFQYLRSSGNQMGIVICMGTFFFFFLSSSDANYLLEWCWLLRICILMPC